jgi:hypothetical protein
MNVILVLDRVPVYKISSMDYGILSKGWIDFCKTKIIIMSFCFEKKFPLLHNLPIYCTFKKWTSMYVINYN